MKIIPSFSQDDSLSKLVENSQPGLFFFHNPHHVGSYQILNDSMEEFKKTGVKHFYLRLPQEIFGIILEQHFNDPISFQAVLIEKFNVIKNLEYRSCLQNLVLKAHQVGIQVFAVDQANVLKTQELLIGDIKSANKLLQDREEQEVSLIETIKKHRSLLSPSEKYIGLFGSLRSTICSPQHLDTPSVLFHALDMNWGCNTHVNLSPNEIIGNDEKSSQHIQQFDIFTTLPPDLKNTLDLKRPVKSQSLGLLNQVLKKLEIPLICQAFARGSERVDAAVRQPKETFSEVWNQVCLKLDPLPKRSVDLKNNYWLIIFQNIDDPSLYQLLSESLVQLEKASQ